MTRVHRWPQVLPILEGKVREPIQTKKHSTTYNDIDPGTLKLAPWACGISNYMVILCWPSLIIIHLSFPFSVSQSLAFMDCDTWDPSPSGFPLRMTNERKWQNIRGRDWGIFSPGLSFCFSIVLGSGLIPLWTQHLWVACLSHSSSHRPLILLFPQLPL